MDSALSVIVPLIEKVLLVVPLQAIQVPLGLGRVRHCQNAVGHAAHVCLEVPLKLAALCIVHHAHDQDMLRVRCRLYSGGKRRGGKGLI